MKQHWFFDLDGTIADTDRDIRETWKSVMMDLGLSCEDFDDKFVTGPPIGVIAKQLFPDRYSEELVRQLYEGFGNHYDNDGLPNTNLFPRAIEEIRKLRAAGAKVYIATNKRYAGAKAVIAKFEIGGLFDAVYAGDMHKDDEIGVLAKPQLLELALRELGIDSDDAVMVGDTISDFAAAKAVGMASVAVPWGYGTQAELAEATARWNGKGDIAALI